MPKAIKHTDKILRNGQTVGTIKTERGVMEILEIVESRGYQTDFFPKAFRYVRLPNGLIFSLKKYMIQNWEDNGWHINYCNGEGK